LAGKWIQRRPGKAIRADVQEAVETVVNDATIHGTYVLRQGTNAERSGGRRKKSKALGDWTGALGKIYFKVFHDAPGSPGISKVAKIKGLLPFDMSLQEIAPKTLFEFTLTPYSWENEPSYRARFRGHRGNPANSKKITDKLRGHSTANAKETLNPKRESTAQIVAKEGPAEAQAGGGGRGLSSAESSAQDLVQRVQELRQ